MFRHALSRYLERKFFPFLTELYYFCKDVPPVTYGDIDSGNEFFRNGKNDCLFNIGISIILWIYADGHGPD